MGPRTLGVDLDQTPAELGLPLMKAERPAVQLYSNAQPPPMEKI
jgi:hypothetical protein